MGFALAAALGVSGMSKSRQIGNRRMNSEGSPPTRRKMPFAGLLARLITALCLVTTAAHADSYLDSFTAISYSGDNGTSNWSTPWTEVGDDNVVTTGNIFVESHAQNPTPNTPALKIKVATSGAYVWREANLSSATTATLSYQYHNEINSPGVVLLQISSNGGGSWTTLRTYTAADAFGSESINITAYRASNTRIRFIASVVGGRHLRVDEVGIVFLGPGITITAIKFSAILSDPLNNLTNPKRIPGAVVEYSVTMTNTGTSSPDAGTVVVTDAIDRANLAFRVGSGVTFTDGATSSGLSLASVSYSSTPAPGPYLYNYTPVPDVDGYDGFITSLRATTTGSFASGGTPPPSFTLKYQVKVK